MSNMKRLLVSSIILCASLLPRGDGIASPQVKPQSSYDLLAAKQQHFLQYNQDFLDFAKAEEGGPKAYSTDHLLSVAEKVTTQVQAALEVHGDLACPEDKTRIRSFLRMKFVSYGRQMDLSAEETNIYIAATRKPGIAAETTQMREDLREAKSILESVKLE